MIHPGWLILRTPNLSPRKKKVSLIVLHHTGGAVHGAVSWLTNPISKVSADFVISRTGKIWKLNPDLHSLYTWHAGRSIWKLFKDVNKFSVGIEMEHFVGEDWPEVQVESVAKLCVWLLKEFSLDVNNKVIQSHRAVAWPFGRKTDPEGFPWSEFGVGVRECLKSRM